MKSVLYKLISYRAVFLFAYIFIFNPLYFLACRSLYRTVHARILLIPDHEIYLYILIAAYIGIYVYLVFNLIEFLRAIKRAAEPVKPSSPKTIRDFSNFKRKNTIFHDEISILVESMQNMLVNLRTQNKELAQSRAQMQELVRMTLKSQESERRLVAHELHDEAGQLLGNLRNKISSLLADLEADSSPGHSSPLDMDHLQNVLAEAIKEIDVTWSALRSLSHQMRPPLFDVGNINLAFSEYCIKFQNAHRISVFYEGDDLPGLSEEASMSFFRFLQEGLTNVSRHASATEVDVTFTSEGGFIKMSLQDNGKGGDPEAENSGIGILGMRERFHLLEGSVTTESTPRGFLISASVPINDNILKDYTP